MAASYNQILRKPIRSSLKALGIYPYARYLYRLTTDPSWRALRDLVDQDIREDKDVVIRLSARTPQNRNSPRALFLSTLPHLVNIKLEAILSVAARYAGYSVTILNHTASHWPKKYHQLFKNSDITTFDKVSPKIKLTPVENQILEVLQKDEVGFQEIFNFTYRGVDVGRIALSMFLYKHKFNGISPNSPDGLRIIKQGIPEVFANIGMAEHLLNKWKPEVVFVAEKGLSPAAEIVGLALARNIPVIQHCGSQRGGEYVLKRFQGDNKFHHPFSLSAKTWENTLCTVKESDEKWIRDEIISSYETGSWFNRRHYHSEKKKKECTEIVKSLELDPSKKTAVIFSHVLWDATFFYGKGLFEDYQTWLIETIQAAKGNNRVNWIIKLHPDLVWKLKLEGQTGEVYDVKLLRETFGSLPPHIKIVEPSTNISTLSFFELTDYCITVRGTIGIEMACFGIPVLTAGTGRYAGFGFTYDSDSKEEYLERIRHIDHLPEMTAEQTSHARKFAYRLFKKRTWKLKNFEFIKGTTDVSKGWKEDNLKLKNAASKHSWLDYEEIAKVTDWLKSKDEDYLDE